jgi:hypothetical protein
MTLARRVFGSISHQALVSATYRMCVLASVSNFVQTRAARRAHPP